jgi:uncharacterized protein DUF955
MNSCVDRALGLLTSELRAQFVTDPLHVLRSDLGLTVTAVDHLAETRADGGACDGVSFLEDGVILYAPTPSSRRENFTLAHELGHWLAEAADGVYDWIADQEQPGRLLETVCDRIAQSLLLPDSAAVNTVGDGPLRAQHLIDLFSSTQASRPVCAIALAKRLPAVGAVAIIDRYSRSVSHASVRPDPDRGWPIVFPWRGQELDEAHVLLRLSAGASTSRRIAWETPWGARADFYIDALGDDRRIYAVLCDLDLWGIERFHASASRDYDTRPMLTGSCCGAIFERLGYPCPDCNQPYCPKCHECRCQRDSRRAISCSRCFLQVQPHLITDGVCIDCRS